MHIRFLEAEDFLMGEVVVTFLTGSVVSFRAKIKPPLLLWDADLKRIQDENRQNAIFFATFNHLSRCRDEPSEENDQKYPQIH